MLSFNVLLAILVQSSNPFFLKMTTFLFSFSCLSYKISLAPKGEKKEKGGGRERENENNTPQNKTLKLQVKLLKNGAVGYGARESGFFFTSTCL